LSASGSASVPRPPAPFDPLSEEVAAGTELFRCHSDQFDPREFNATPASARFRPLVMGGAIVPTMYVAHDLSGALFETVFRDVPVETPTRRVSAALLGRVVRSALAPTRILNLAVLHGVGLGRLGVRREKLTATDSSAYPDTVPWAEAVYLDRRRFDGLSWRSRQNEDALVAMLFGDRVARRDLDVVLGPEPLDAEPAWSDVLAVAEDAGITVVV
jgi:hypothetical protein